jgi:antitoxin (DNA-binding transcriptional repressor) of toxin-antitoxin stability system
MWCPSPRHAANLSELADQAKAGAEKIITKNGESYVALIDADRLDYYHRLERERIHLLLIDDARRGLADRTGRPHTRGRCRPGGPAGCPRQLQGQQTKVQVTWLSRFTGSN